MWARMRGIMGYPENWVQRLDRPYVGSVPDRNRTWHAITYDPVSSVVYWHDQAQFAFYKQPLQACLLDRSSKDIEVIFRKQHQQV